MTKQRRWLPRLMVFLILLFFPLAIAPLLPLDSLKPAVESRLSASLGRKVTVGSLRLSFWGGPYLTINGMTAKEDSAFGDGDFLKADQVRADLALLDYLLHREVVIDGITIKSPEFTFIKNSNGAWSWTTIGRRAPEQAAMSRSLAFEAAPTLFAAMGLFFQDLKKASFNDIQIEGASVRLIDETGEQPPESLYKNIKLSASITRPAAGTSHATGELRAESDESDNAEILKTSLPFDLKIERSANPALSVGGTLGPGPLQTKNFTAQTFKLDGQISAGSGITGSGHISSGEIFVSSVNIAQQVARALNIGQVGDMNQGTGISILETDFRIGQGQVNTSNLSIQQLDGLGDATADNGWFKIESALMLNYVATVLLSPEATKQVKTINPLIGAAITVLESNNRVSVPVNITGDVRNPQVQVDVSRIF